VPGTETAAVTKAHRHTWQTGNRARPSRRKYSFVQLARTPGGVCHDRRRWQPRDGKLAAGPERPGNARNRWRERFGVRHVARAAVAAREGVFLDSFFAWHGGVPPRRMKRKMGQRGHSRKGCTGLPFWQVPKSIPEKGLGDRVRRGSIRCMFWNTVGRVCPGLENGWCLESLQAAKRFDTRPLPRAHRPAEFRRLHGERL
jgi:hypothetical protein